MASKKAVGTQVETSTATKTEPDGTIVETTTTKTTTTYSDGTKGISTQVSTKKRPPGAGQPGAQLQTNETPAQSKAPKVPNTTDKRFIQEALEQHNLLRSKHNAKPLTLNEDLGKIAQAWANHLAEKVGQMQHSTCGFGENVYWSTHHVDGKRPVDSWYSEIKDYNFGKLEGQKGCGHFTQVIWKSSKELGIAMQKGKGGYFVVANYFPAGNFIGKYPENIERNHGGVIGADLAKAMSTKTANTQHPVRSKGKSRGKAIEESNKLRKKQ